MPVGCAAWREGRLQGSQSASGKIRNTICYNSFTVLQGLTCVTNSKTIYMLPAKTGVIGCAGSEK